MFAREFRALDPEEYERCIKEGLVKVRKHGGKILTVFDVVL